MYTAMLSTMVFFVLIKAASWRPAGEHHCSAVAAKLGLWAANLNPGWGPSAAYPSLWLCPLHDHGTGFGAT